ERERERGHVIAPSEIRCKITRLSLLLVRRDHPEIRLHGNAHAFREPDVSGAVIASRTQVNSELRFGNRRGRSAGRSKSVRRKTVEIKCRSIPTRGLMAGTGKSVSLKTPLATPAGLEPAACRLEGGSQHRTIRD